jgi:hypothetical protein
VLFIYHYYYFSTTHCSLLRLIVRSGLDVPTFATRRLHACHHASRFQVAAEERISTRMLVFFPSVPPDKFRDSSSKSTRILSYHITSYSLIILRRQWVPVTTVRCFLRLRSKEQPPYICMKGSCEYLTPFVTSGTYISHLQRVFSSPLG